MELRYFFTFNGVRIESLDPAGNPQPALNWIESEKVIKRSEIHDGITYVYASEHEFIDNVVPFIDAAKAAGIGSEMLMEIFSLNEQTQDFDLEYEGIVDLPNAKKTIKSSGTAIYKITTKQIGWENEFDLNFDTKVNLSDNTDLSGNPIPAMIRPSDFIALQPQPILKAIDVESEAPNSFDGGSDIEADELQNYYYFFTINHQIKTRQELGDAFQDLSTLQYEDYDYAGPLPTVPQPHQTILEDAPHSPTLNGLWQIKADVDGDYNWTWSAELNYLIDGVAERINRWDYWLIGVIVNRDDVLNPTYTIEQFHHKGVENYDINILSLDDIFALQKVTSLKAGEELYLIPYMCLRPENTGVGNTISFNTFQINVVRSKFTLLGKTEFDQTSSAALLAHEAFSRLTNKITGRYNIFKSSFFGRTDSQPRPYSQDGIGSLTSFLSGQHLRGWTIGEEEGSKPFNTSFKQLFEAVRKIFNLGIGTHLGEVIIEERKYFYDKENMVVDLGCVPELQVDYDLTSFYNKLSIGYSKFKNSENKDGQGLQVFNATKYYNTQLNIVDNTLDLVSDLITAGYMIETTRREQKALGSEKETQNDLELFAIALLRTGVEINLATAQNPAFINETWDPASPSNPWQEILGIDFPEQAYNVRFQPSRMVKNWGEEIRLSIKQSNDILQLQIVDGNRDFSSQLKTETAPVEEGVNVNGSTLDAALFNGDTYECEQTLTYEQIKAVETYPYGYFRLFDFYGKEYRGFLKGEMNINLNSKLCKFVLIGYDF